MYRNGLRHAAVMVPVCGDRALFLRRAGHLAFQPSYYSFPGGGVDAPRDRLPDAWSDGGGDRVSAAAGLREMIEEAGIWPAAELNSAQRQAVFDGRSELADLGLPEPDLRYLGRYVTPPYAHRRFDTFFYRVAFAEAQAATINEESELAVWWTEAEALERWRDGRMIASQPVLRALAAALHPAPPFDSASEPRGLLYAGGGASYLPLRTMTLPPATHTNCVFVRGGGELWVVDPAPTEADEQAHLIAVIEAQDVPLTGVFLTHLHHDHIGAAAAVSAHFEVPIAASRRTADDLLAGGGSGASSGGFALDALPRVGRLFAAGDRVAGAWEVIETPGHAHGHLCLFDEATRTLIAGDMLADGSTVVIEPDQGDMTAYLASLTQLAGLDPRLIIAAHGMPIARGAAALEGLIAHRLRREAKVRAALLSSGGGDPSALVAEAYADTPEFLWPLAELSLESHLLRLVELGEAERDGARFSPAAAARAVDSVGQPK